MRGDVLGLVGGEIERHVGDVDGLAEVLDHAVGRVARLRLGGEVLGDGLRGDDAGVEHVDAHTCVRDLTRHLTAEVVDAGLGHAVADLRTVGAHGGDRADVDDAAGVLLDHGLVERFLAGVEHGRKVNTDRLFKLFVGALGDVEVLAGVGLAKVVDQHVEAAFLGDALVDHASVRGGVVRLKVHELGLSAAGSCRLNGRFTGLHVAAGVVDLCALINEEVSDRAADAAGARRDQRDFSFQSVTHNRILPF